MSRCAHGVGVEHLDRLAAGSATPTVVVPVS